MSEFVTPTWLNIEFLEAAMRTEYHDSAVSVTSSCVEAATKEGDNHFSEMYRVLIQITRRGQEEERSLIVKTKPKKKQMLNIVEDGNLFLVETKVYVYIIPSMHNLLNETSLEKPFHFSANYIYSLSNPATTAIVLEDLSKQGFRMADRTLGLDLEHCQLVIRNLARFHAISVVLQKRNPDIFKPFLKTIFCDEMRKSVQEFFTLNSVALAKELSTWPTVTRRIAAKIEKIAKHAVDYWIEGVTRGDEEFNVLAHGDLWFNNVMFRYCRDTGRVTDMRFVDFQLSYWTSPAVDLLYFLNSSLSLEVADKLDIFVEEYQKTLGETLSLFGYQHLQPSVEYINTKLQERGVLGVIAGMIVRSVVLTDRTTVPDVDTVSKPEHSSLFSDTCREVLKKMLPFYENKGWM